MKPDVIVVGGGIAGVTVVWQLARRGCKVQLLERQRFGAEASGGLAGLLTTAADGHEHGPYAELSRAGLEATLHAVAEIESETGIDIELKSNPLIRVGFDEASCKSLRDFSQRASAAEDEESWLDEQQLKKEFPQIAPRAKGAALLPHARHLNPRQFLAATLKATQASNTVERCPVEATSLMRRGARIVGILDSAGEQWHADHVIVANGVWARDLLRSAKIDLPLRPVRGQILVLDGSGRPELPFIVSPGAGYIVPKSGGRIVVGATHEETGAKVQTLAAMAHLTRIASAVPHLLPLPITEVFVGLRPMSPDGMPLLGRVAGCEGLSLALGYGQHGILLANVCAGMVARDALGDDPGPLWTSFQAARAISQPEQILS